MLRSSKIILAVLLTISIFIISGASSLSSSVYKDVEGHQAESAIIWATNQKLVKGYKDGSFKPNLEVTEAEFLAMLLRLFPNAITLLNKSTSKPSDNWSDSYYSVAALFNMPVTGLVEPKQRVNAITRGQVAELVTGAFGFHYDTDGSIAFLFDRGLSIGRSGKTIKGYEASKNLTRAEVVVLLKLVSDKSPSPELQVRAKELSSNKSTDKYRDKMSLFYGTNGHLSQGGAYRKTSFATQLSQLQDLGMTVYRNDIWDASTATQLAEMADAFAGSGVQIVPVLTPKPQAYSNEAEAYKKGFDLGQAAARALSGKVGYYQVGNELEVGAIIPRADGVSSKDYDNSKFVKARGSIRGMIAGIKSIDDSAQIISASAGWLHYAFNDMLWNGVQPDGSTGNDVIRWDITSWHWYSDMRDITQACGGSGCYNVLQQLKDRFDKPIWLTEYGVRPNVGNDEQIAEYTTGDKMLAQFVSLASAYHIQSVAQYSLYDDLKYGGDGNYGLLKDDGISQKVSYDAIKRFIKSHPMD
ncbi:S-layer homology domain-containing protein [Cohnella abietis]|uniref:SLH domain-containing protein n=1 Tax=Cohnella abietis TaxID=2507935 RepID=A0A3T1D160_9BACL|nr:S-layer homology domain-containing protein [Cohnella abietis]BBI31798.1 hypothetical protein KCTCHS21_11970 [Cohnella abietis]